MGIGGGVSVVPHRPVPRVVPAVDDTRHASLLAKILTLRDEDVDPVDGRTPGCSRCSSRGNPAAGSVGSGSTSCTRDRSSTRTRSDRTSAGTSYTGECSSTIRLASVAPGFGVSRHPAGTVPAAARETGQAARETAPAARETARETARRETARETVLETVLETARRQPRAGTVPAGA